jgi:cytoskeleton protein RodZ
MTDIGAMLREARMREHLDIAEFEARTKIRAKYLRALEDEEWGLLPGYTFTKAFLRTYADMLGLDGRMLVDEFKRQYPDPSEVELATVLPPRREARRMRERARERERERPHERPGERRQRSGGGPSGRVLVVALLVVLVAAAVFVVRELNKGTGTPTSTSTTHSTTTPARKHKHAATGAKKASRPAVSLRIVATTPVHVCLIGITTHGFSHQRLPAIGSPTTTALLSPGARAPTYHADRRFLVSFSGGSARMELAHRTVTVDAAATTLAYQVTRSGYSLLAPAAAPRCK